MTFFDYSNKILTVVLTVFSGTNIFSNVNNKPLLGLITSVFSLSFSLSFGMIIKLQQETKLRKKKLNKLLYLVKNKCKKDTENKNPKVFKTKNERLLLKSICSVCTNKKSIFISKNEGSGLLSSLGIKTPWDQNS